MPFILHVSSTRLVWINSLVDNVDDSAVTDATILMDVDDLDGVSVQTGITFTHSGSGTWYGKFLHADALTDGDTYILKITITSNDEITQEYLEIRAVAQLNRGV